MDQENKKPNVFNEVSENDKEFVKTTDYDKIDEIQLQYATEGELFHANVMKENSERQLKFKREGEKMGLFGKELKQYVIDNTKDISVRSELSEVKPKGSITYDSDKTINKINFDENGHIVGVQSNDLSDEALSLIKESEKTITEQENAEIKALNEKLDRWYEKMSEAQYDAPFELVSIPSQGKQYGFKDKFIKMAFLNGSDEEVLTNPNIAKSGRFLEILFKRKILSDITYEELIPADRDALMVWLRGTAYGSDYPIEVVDPKDESAFEVMLDLSELPINYLNLNTNKNGLFEFKSSVNNIFEFKFLTIGQLSKIEDQIISGYDSDGELYTESSTDFLCEIIQSINGETDKVKLRTKIKYMSLKEINEFKKFMAENDFGVDFNLRITTPGGESITTPFPINRNFFWSEF